MKNYHTSQSRGFTILELLVAMGVTAGIVLLLTSVTRIALDTYRSGADEMRSVRQSQAALSTIQSDLEGIVIKPVAPSALGTRAQAVSTWLAIESSPVDVEGKNASGVTFAFFSRTSDRYDGNLIPKNNATYGLDAKSGDVSGIRYTLEYEDQLSETGVSTGNTRILNLYRQRIEPFTAYNDIFVAGNKPRGGGGGNLGVRPEDPDFLFEAFETVSGRRTDQERYRDDFLVENVYEMSVIFEVERENAGGAATAARRDFVVISSGANSENRLTVRGDRIEEPAAFENDKIKSVNIGLTILSDAGMERLRNGATPDKSFIRQYGQTYSAKADIID